MPELTVSQSGLQSFEVTIKVTLEDGSIHFAEYTTLEISRNAAFVEACRRVESHFGSRAKGKSIVTRPCEDIPHVRCTH